MTKPIEAILFSVDSGFADVDDAVRHLGEHKSLHWSVGFPVVKDQFAFPIFGFMHVTGAGQVEYKALITDVLPFDARDYDEPQYKPEAWRLNWDKNIHNMRSRPWKTTFVITEIIPFSFETTKFTRVGGAPVKSPPRSYIRVMLPTQEAVPVPVPSHKLSVTEGELEHLLVRQLEAIEPGLVLVKRQMGTPAGRLDLFCTDREGNYVVVELKKTRGTDQVVGQVLRYMGWARSNFPDKKVRGIIVVERQDDTLRYALSVVPDIVAKEFQVSIV